MEYKFGESYEFDVIDLRIDQNSGAPYVAVCNDNCGDNKEYRIYNVLKCQLEKIPSKMFVTLKSRDVFDRVIFKQDIKKVFADHYKYRNEYVFHIDDIKTDYKDPNIKFYVISDDFAEHHLYFNISSKQKYRIGDECRLVVEGQTEKGFLKLKDSGICQSNIKHNASDTTSDPTPHPESTSQNTGGIFCEMDENTTTEFKTSIVFPPDGTGTPNIDKQLYNIVREIASFMNSKGGKLYIGVHDKNREIVGIEGDYEHLNEGTTEHQFAPNRDGYQLRIREAINKMCNGLANSLMEIEFKQEQNHDYCIVSVSSAIRPIWVNGNKLFTRTGNRVTQLYGEDITSFIYEKTSYSILDKLDIDDAFASFSPDVVADIVRSTMKAYINETKPKRTIVNIPADEVYYYIVWKNDRTWFRQKEKSSDADIAFQLPVRKSDHDSILIFCYDNGKVNEIELSRFKEKTKLGQVKQNGFCEKSALKEIFLAPRGSLLAVYSRNQHGQQMVKVHHISDINPTGSPANQGAAIIPTTGVPELYKLVSGAYVKMVKSLIMQSNQTSQSFGYPVNSFQEDIAAAVKCLNDL